MPKVRIEPDEWFPVFSVEDPDHSIGLLADVSEAQLSYWEMVRREWDRVQLQMATALCAASDHKGRKPEVHHCLTCSPPAVVTP
jgi:hypothetical protein